MSFDTLNIPKIPLQKFSRGETSYQTKLYIQYGDIVRQTEFGKAVKNELINDDRIKRLVEYYKEKQVAFDIDKLTYWFIWRINSVGKDEAINNLNNYLDENKNEVEAIHILWILGVEIENSINLFDDITIEPIENMPNSDYKEKFLQSRFQHFPLITPTPYSALVLRQKEEVNKDSTRIINASFILDDIALLINLISNTSCLSYASIKEYENSYPYGPFGGSGCSSVFYDVVGNKNTKLTEDDFSEIENLYKVYSTFEDKKRQKFNTIINRIRQSKRRENIEDKILDLVIAMEMMLLDNNDKSQLKLSFRLRGSMLLASTDEEKSRLFLLFGKLYDYRSLVAHSGSLKDSDKKLIKKEFSSYSELAEKICKNLILNSTPDWDKLILGIEEN